MTSRIPRSLRRRLAAEAQKRCSYCHTPTGMTGARMVVDHILPEAAGGATEWGNLCLACTSCNEFKGKRTSARDPLTGEIAPLFDPRSQSWREHFRWSLDGGEIIGLTPTGRATAAALQMNYTDIVEARRRWAKVGWHPPADERS